MAKKIAKEKMSPIVKIGLFITLASMFFFVAFHESYTKLFYNLHLYEKPTYIQSSLFMLPVIIGVALIMFGSFFKVRSLFLRILATVLSTIIVSFVLFWLLVFLIISAYGLSF